MMVRSALIKITTAVTNCKWMYTSTCRMYFSLFTQSTLVVGFHLIISNGIQVKLTRGDETFDQCQEKIKRARYGGNPVELKSNDVFRAVAVGLGSLGVIYSITYRCIPVYNIEEERTVVQIPWPGQKAFRVQHKFEAILRNRTGGEFFSVFVNPYPEPKR